MNRSGKAGKTACPGKKIPDETRGRLRQMLEAVQPQNERGRGGATPPFATVPAPG